MPSFYSPTGNYEIWKKKPKGYFTEEAWLEKNPPILPTLEEVKEAKIKEINTTRNTLEQGGFNFKGSRFDSDQISYMRLLGASQTAQTSLASGVPYSVDWTLQDNTTLTMNAQDMIEIIPTFAVYSNELHQKASMLKTEIEDATTIEEVSAIRWND